MSERKVMDEQTVRALLEIEEDVPAATYANGVGMEFVLVPAGRFWMGSRDEDGEAFDDEKPCREVTISRPFHLGRYPVTQAQWESVMGNNPSGFRGPERPVENVSWEDVQAFIAKLNAKEGAARYRLPTEAEWEYACRAGSASRYCFGDDTSRLGDYAWYRDNSGDETHPVGRKRPNAWGLYDMHGNVWEWVQDGWRAGYRRRRRAVTDPVEPAGEFRVQRGGSWLDSAWGCRSTYRLRRVPGGCGRNFGFRLALSPGH